MSEEVGNDFTINGAHLSWSMKLPCQRVQAGHVHGELKDVVSKQ